MKRNTALLIIILVLSILLFGCGQNSDSTRPSAETVEPTETAEATQATEPEATEETAHEPSIPQETHIPEASIIAEPDYTSYYDLLAPSNEGNPLSDAMNCSFLLPQQLDLARVFYSGLIPGSWSTLSEESAAALEAAGFNKNLDLQIRPAKDLEQLLQTCFGISLKDVESGIPESWVYLESEDCYYSNHSDALGYPQYTITWVEQLGSDRIEISYTIEADRWYDTLSKTYLDHPHMIMTLQCGADGSYQMLSNYLVPSK